MSAIRWLLSSGSDNSHLYDARWFDRLRDARQAAAELPLTPNGEKRPYQIRRVEYRNVIPGWERVVDERIVERRQL